MSDTEKVTNFKRLMRELNALIKKHGWDSQITNDHADSMDQPWYDLSEEEKDIFRLHNPDVGDHFDENA